MDKWFELVKEEIVDAGVEPKDTYGMDETANPRGNLAKERVTGAQGTKTQHQQGGANRENVTAIVTICADGTTLHPTVIFKAKNLYTRWTTNNVSNATYVSSTLMITAINDLDNVGAQCRKTDGPIAR